MQHGIVNWADDDDGADKLRVPQRSQYHGQPADQDWRLEAEGMQQANEVVGMPSRTDSKTRLDLQDTMPRCQACQGRLAEEDNGPTVAGPFAKVKSY